VLENRPKRKICLSFSFYSPSIIIVEVVSMSGQQSHAHHYVPQWYQRRFLPPGQSRYYYLDMNPDTVVRDGVSYRRNELLHWGPGRCFYKDDLYTLRFGPATTDAMERLFFGQVDRLGMAAVTEMAEFAGIRTLSSPDAFGNLPPYMGAQRFRTPRGLDEVKKISAREDLTPIGEAYVSTRRFRLPPQLIRMRKWRSALAHDDPNQVLADLTGVFQAYSTMWTEGVWELVRARQSKTKFIVIDNPVTFYCKTMFPSEWTYPEDCNLKQIGTRTIFPLGLDSCLIITHLQLARHPSATATEHRENARYYDRTVKHLGEIQFGEEREVVRVNYILKKRATRYIAAAEREWLYPEQRVSTTDWTLLDEDWFLLPNLWKVSFTSEIVMGGNGWSWAMDEYGRHPGNPQFKNKLQHDIDWVLRDVSKRAWAKKRIGKSLALVDEFRHGAGNVEDKIMRKYLEDEGLLPRSAVSEPESGAAAPEVKAGVAPSEPSTPTA